jgi:hypothetical protein
MAAHQLCERQQGQRLGIAIGCGLIHQHLPGGSEIPTTGCRCREDLPGEREGLRTPERGKAPTVLRAGSHQFDLAQGKGDPFPLGQPQVCLPSLESLNKGDLGAGLTSSARNSDKIPYPNGAGDTRP